MRKYEKRTMRRATQAGRKRLMGRDLSHFLFLVYAIRHMAKWCFISYDFVLPHNHHTCAVTAILTAKLSLAYDTWS